MRFIIVAAAVLTKGAVSQAAVATKTGQVSFEAAKCSACGAVAQELLLALDHEVKQRKITPSPSSTDLAVPLTESRFFDILESVCSRMEDYTLVEHEGESKFVLVSSLGQTDGSSDGITTKSTSGSSGIRVRHEGGLVGRDGASTFTELRGHHLQLGGEDAARATRRLTTYCQETLGEHEEALLNALLRSERPPQELGELLCSGLTSACNDASFLDVSLSPDGESDVFMGGVGATNHQQTHIGSKSVGKEEVPKATSKKKKKRTKGKGGEGKKRAAPLGGRAPPEGSTISAVPGN